MTSEQQDELQRLWRAYLDRKARYESHLQEYENAVQGPVYGYGAEFSQWKTHAQEQVEVQRVLTKKCLDDYETYKRGIVEITTASTGDPVEAVASVQAVDNDIKTTLGTGEKTPDKSTKTNIVTVVVIVVSVVVVVSAVCYFIFRKKKS